MAIVSVVIPSYNRGHCIRESIDSVLQQTVQDIEIIVVDDASKDDTRAQVEAIADPRVRYLAHENNRGGGAARNTGIQAASAEFIAFLDSDDTWAANKLELQLAELERKGPDYGFVYTWLIGVDPRGRELWRFSDVLDGAKVAALFMRNAVGTFSSVMVRRSALVAAGGMDEQMRSCQDWDLFVRINQVTKICCVQQYLVRYLQNSGDRHRISANPTKIIAGHQRMLSKLRPQLEEMGVAVKVATFKEFAKVFVSAASLGNVTRMIAEVLKLMPTPSNLVWALLTLARVCKRKITRNVGY
ncbi:glycosyltransferase family 2 protein [Herbaspirillum chlorophenolicum]|uniref:glycosyltransferase family 2 protein n=1 Tax=Herbaspirillum chlorophenolicum TaxID=211589 RepID=UPI00067CDE53|nr:glycosyltransferase family 2 protein [Herbaspirillum chlorophenolicum]